MTDEITPDEFDAIAAICTRWEKRTLDAMRVLLVDGKSAAHVAKQFSMSNAQVSVSRARFVAKLPAYRLAEFKKRVKPAGKKYNVFDDVAAELDALTADGYTPEQLVKYLKEHGIKANTMDVTEFLKGRQS